MEGKKLLLSNSGKYHFDTWKSNSGPTAPANQSTGCVIVRLESYFPSIQACNLRANRALGQAVSTDAHCRSY